MTITEQDGRSVDLESMLRQRLASRFVTGECQPLVEERADLAFQLAGGPVGIGAFGFVEGARLRVRQINHRKIIAARRANLTFERVAFFGRFLRHFALEKRRNP